MFDRYIHQGNDILDLGVGGGRTTPYLDGVADRYVGVDYAAGMVEACRDRFPGLEFHEADAADLSRFDDGSFDTVVFTFAGIDYLTRSEERERCLSECRRVLRDGGMLIFSRHNPRAIVRLPGRDAGTPVGKLRAVVAVPLWAVRRSFRKVPTRAFWSGEGPVVQPPHGFNAPLLPWSRSHRPAAEGHDEIFTQMATPRRVREELARSGYDVAAVEGVAYPARPWALATNSYYYAAVKA